MSGWKNITATLLFAASLACLAIGLRPALGQGEAALPSLHVVVTDALGAGIGGATCTLYQDNKVISTLVTSESGEAEFAVSADGRYDLVVTKNGFRAYEKRSLSVSDKVSIAVALEVSGVDASLSVDAAAINSEVTVSAGSLVPTGELQTRALKGLPLAAKRVDDTIPLVPGVIRSSTGEISINGSSEAASSFRVNGLNVSDPANGGFRLNLPIEAVQTVQVFKHPYSSEFGQFTGGLTNIETRRGGDTWHFEANDFLPDFRFVGGKIVGISDDSPHVNFNGPLIRRTLFVSQSLGYAISKTPVRGLAFPNNETKSEAMASFTQFDLVATPRHTQTVTFGYFPERNSFIGLDFFKPKSVTANFKQKDRVVTFHDTWAVTDQTVLHGSVSYKVFDADVWGQGPGEQFFTPTGEAGNYFATQDRRSSRFEFLGSYERSELKFLNGTNDLKAGFDMSVVSSRMTYTARPVNILRANGTLAQRITFDRPGSINIINHAYAVYVQDKYEPRQNLTFDLGLRFEDQRIASEKNVSPRGGFAWSPFKGDRTVIRGGAGLFFDKVPLNIRSFSRFPPRTVTDYAADGIAVLSQVRYRNVLTDSLDRFPQSFRAARVREIGYIPENLRWNLQIDELLNSSVSLRVNYTHSQTTRVYVPNQETDRIGVNAILLSPTGRVIYDSLEVSARFALPKKQTFFLSYVRSRAKGDLNDFNAYFGDLGIPVLRPNQFGNLSVDVPNRLLGWGTFALPHKVSVSPIVEWRSGFPYSVVDEMQNFVGVRNADQHRFPRFFSLDVEIAKDFQVTRKYAVRPSLKIFNVTNHFNPRNIRNNLADPQFGTFLNNYRRYFTGGFDIIF